MQSKFLSCSGYSLQEDKHVVAMLGCMKEKKLNINQYSVAKDNIT